VYRSTGSDEKEIKPLMPKSMSESPKNTDVEEKKTSINKDGLNKDMLMKLDQQNLNHGKIPSKLFGPEFYYATPSIISSTSNTTTTKTIKSRKLTKLMPNKKYLAEMKSIGVLLRLSDKDFESGYVNCQVVLSQDTEVEKDFSTPTENSKSLSKIFEAIPEMAAQKDTPSKVNTPNRKNRTMSTESTDTKTD
jgi:hypothetical protein